MFFSKKNKKDVASSASGKLKKEWFDLNKIERFFHLSDKSEFHQVISDRTFLDIDMNEIFMFIDRTSSRIGQQFLYYVLRTIPTNSTRIEYFEKIIHVINGDAETQKQILSEISKLNHKDVYHIPTLFLEKHIQKPKWFWVVQCLAFFSVSLVILSFLFPKLLICLILLLPINFGFHYWNKLNIYRYSNSIPQLIKLNQVAGSLVSIPVLAHLQPCVLESIRQLDRLGIHMSLFKLEAKLQSEIGLVIDYLVEVVKAFFLIEPMVLYHVLKELDSKRAEISDVYQFVGHIDVALSIKFLRADLPYFCMPQTTSSAKHIKAVDIFHPLIYKGVSNSIDLQGKSVLLTGSNMSGKTTFIRTIGINLISAQTINTCFAKTFIHPRLRIHAAIRMADDLLGEKSYYFEEVLAIKNLLDESKSGFGNLFLLDELFKGTNTVERIASGKAVLNYLNEGDNIIMVATHDFELADFLSHGFSLYHFTEVVQQDDIVFDYKIKPGTLTNTNAIRILELNGYPQTVVEEASELAESIYKGKCKS